MSEPTSPSIERDAPRDLEQLALELAELDPKPVTYFTPDNLDEVMADFLSGERRNPDSATYSKLDALDFSSREGHYNQILAEILNHPDVPKNHHRVYESYVTRSLAINELMHCAVEYRQAHSEVEKTEATRRFAALNKELYGETDNDTAALMVSEMLEDSSSTTDPTLLRIREEFKQLLPKDLVREEASSQRLQPSQEAQETVSRIVENIYGPLLRHADALVEQMSREAGLLQEKLKVGPQGIAVIFQTIIDKEFPNSGWKVEIKSANAINVVSSSKTVVVPEERLPVSVAKVRGLVVHELGVHMLRSIIGEGADLIPMRFGLAGVGDAEEGIAKVMESVLADDASRTGYQHYLTATLIGRGYDFRDAFEIMWRYKVIDVCLDKPKAKVDDAFINNQKEAAFKFMFRSIRGTNQLPWHITLNYFGGTHKIWQYIESHKDDPDLATFLFMGKIDPTNLDHLKGALDATGRVG